MPTFYEYEEEADRIDEVHKVHNLPNWKRFRIIKKDCMYFFVYSRIRSCTHKQNKYHRCCCKCCPFLRVN